MTNNIFIDKKNLLTICISPKFNLKKIKNYKFVDHFFYYLIFLFIIYIYIYSYGDISNITQR